MNPSLKQTNISTPLHATWNEVGRSEKKYLSLSSKQVEDESILTAGKSFVGVEKCHLQASPHPG